VGVRHGAGQLSEHFKDRWANRPEERGANEPEKMYVQFEKNIKGFSVVDRLICKQTEIFGWII